MNDIIFFVGLTILTFILGFGCFLVYDDERRKSKEKKHHQTNHSRSA